VCVGGGVAGTDTPEQSPLTGEDSRTVDPALLTFSQNDS
jgi:hypothetical protein